VPWRNFISPEFETKFRRAVPLFLRHPILLGCKGVRRILVEVSVPPCRLRRIFFENLTTKWCILTYELVYLNKYVVSIAPFSTPAFTPPPFRTALFCMFSLFNFSSIFPGGGQQLCADVHVGVGEVEGSLHSENQHGPSFRLW